MTLRKISAAMLLALAMLASAVSGPAASAAAVGTARLHRMVVDNAYAAEAGRAMPYTVVDARTRREYDAEHVFSAISVPTADFAGTAGLLPNDKDSPLVVYCGEERSACAQWVDKALSAGYSNVAVYADGFAAWEKDRMPVASTAGRR